ncbi:endonuclease/exonuclease/phosphatase family protein [Streptomyces sp. NPDC059175]|uniref:endonuclease/exonuclease/phosphatase family protein n=1 Tax=unclassified Streptomyces TaxID=2593676 RepID=UPI0036AC8098
MEPDTPPPDHAFGDAHTTGTRVRRPPFRRRAAACGAGTALAAVSLVVGFRAADADGPTPFPQFLAFLPWFLVPAAVGLGLAAVARNRFLLVWAVAAATVTTWYVRPYGPDRTDHRGPVVAHLEVLTSNVEFGRATGDLVAAIRREKPDLVFVEECDRTCSAALVSQVPQRDYPYRNVVEGNLAVGSAILSVHPMSNTAGIRSALAMPGAEARIGGRTVRLQLVHPLPPVPGRIGAWRTELAGVRAYAARAEGVPTLLAGDFNAGQDHAAFRRVLDAGGLHDSARLAGASRAPSWPSAAPRPLGTQIDHVLVSDDFAVRGVRFLDFTGTDHRALIVELALHSG